MSSKNDPRAGIRASAQPGRVVDRNSAQLTVLLIEDEAGLRRLLRVSLERDGYQVMEAATGQEGIEAASCCQPDILLLDMTLPDMDGISVLKRLREWLQIPIIIVSECTHEALKIAALDCGANDFITKPFSTNELLARLRVTQRYAPPAPPAKPFRAGDLFVDLATRTVEVKGKRTKLTATEYSLLRLFIQNAGKVLTHRQIFREIWGPSDRDNLCYVRVYLANLRKKLESRLIVTEPKVGYRLSLTE